MTRSRLLNRAQKAARSDDEKILDQQLALARSDRDAACRKANVEFEEAVRKAKDTLAEARKKAWDGYAKQRNIVLADFAKRQEQEAA